MTQKHDSSDSNPEIDLELEQLRSAWNLDDKRLMYHVDRGMQGHNKGLSNGMVRLNEYLYGTHKAMYYLIGADSGVGKTTLTDFMYVYSLWKDAKAKGITLDIHYYSWEISTVMKKAKWAALLYFVRYGEMIPAQYIIGRIEGMTITEVQFRRLIEVEKDVEEMFQSITFIEDSTTPLGIWRNTVHRAEKYGEVKRALGQGNEATVVEGFQERADAKDVFRVTIIDHVALCDLPKGFNLKQTIDAISINQTRARNLFGDTTVIIQQFNTELQSAARERKGPVAYKPSRQDFGDSKYTFRDADVVMALTRPLDYDLTEWGPYSRLLEWGQYMTANFLIKNRYGVAGKAVGLFVNHMAGIPTELPDDKTWNSVIQDLYIQKAEDLDKINGYYTPKNQKGSN